MKVLMFMTQFHQPFGAERLAVELAESLNRRGIHTDILSMYREDMPGVAEATQDVLRLGIPQVHFLGLKVKPHKLNLVTSVRLLRRLIREHQYDIVETSQVSPTVIASWATMGGRCGHVAGLHHVFRRRTDNSAYHWFWRLSMKCNRHTRFYAISDFAAAHWLEYSGTSPTRTCRVYNAIPNECFSATSDRDAVCAELGLPIDARIALYVGRLAAYKGIDTIFEALNPIMIEENVYLLYVGVPDPSVPGTEEMIHDVACGVTETDLPNYVRFLDYRKDVPRLMASSDVLVHPARVEGFGLVLVEAMAAGLPVVASNVEGIPEVLAGTDSIMVEPDDAEALRAAVLKTLRRQPDESARAIEKGKQRASDFRTEIRTDAMVKLFEDTLAGRL